MLSSGDDSAPVTLQTPRFVLPYPSSHMRLINKLCACCSAKVVAFSALCDFDATAGATTVLAVLSGSSLQLFSCRVYVLLCRHHLVAVLFIAHMRLRVAFHDQRRCGGAVNTIHGVHGRPG